MILTKIYIGKIAEDKILTRPPRYFEEDYIHGVRYVGVIKIFNDKQDN